MAEFEVDLDIQFNQDGLSVLGGWGELILFDCAEGLVVVCLVQTAKYVHVLGVALLVDPEVDKYAAVDLIASLLLGERGLYLIDDSWGQYAASDSPWDLGHVFGVLGLNLRLAGGAERVFEGDGGVYFGGDSIGEDGFVSPSLHGADGAFAKYFVSAFHGEDFDDSFGGDACVENYCSFAVGCFCFVRVDGANEREEIVGHYGRSDARGGGRWVGLGCRGGCRGGARLRWLQVER